MSFLSRLLELLDDNLHSDLPDPRVSPENAEVPPGRRFQVAGFWSHCRCCLTGPQPCPTVHRLPCDSPGCVTT